MVEWVYLKNHPIKSPTGQPTWPTWPRREAQHAEAQETHDAHGDDATAAHGDLGAVGPRPRRCQGSRAFPTKNGEVNLPKW